MRVFKDGEQIGGSGVTPPVSGGVPEQGPQVYPDLTSEQIEEIARVLDEPQLKRLHGGILALSLRYVAAVQEAPRAIRQLRAALERPRPALPPPDQKIHRVLAAASDLLEEWNATSGELSYRAIERLNTALKGVEGAALPPQTGNLTPQEVYLVEKARDLIRQGCAMVTTNHGVLMTYAEHGRLSGGPQTGNPPPDPLSDEQLLEAFVAGCNAENELNDAELSPQNVRKGVAAAMRGALRGNL